MKKTSMVFFVFVIVATGFLSGCASTLYSWGNFEDNTYSYLKGGTAIDTHIQEMEKDKEKIESSGKPFPPGFYAHLGMLYAETGNRTAAITCFEKEKELFPESVVYMNSLIARARR